MEENISFRYWEFELSSTGSFSVVMTNPVILNTICAMFAPLPDQVVTKIIQKETLIIGMLTMGEETIEKLLTNLSYGIILQELRSISDNFHDFNFESIHLTETGFLLDFDVNKFSTIKSESNQVMVDLCCSQTTTQVFFSPTMCTLDENEMILQALTPSDVEELLRQYSHQVSFDAQPSTSQPSTSQPSTSQPSTSGLNMETVEESEISDEDAITSNIDESVPNHSLNITVHDEDMEDLDELAAREEETEFSLRDYQTELCYHALQGTNCMIVAPTGSGKTIVAAHICKEHILGKRHAKIMFLVPQVPLVKQQSKLLRRYLNGMRHLSSDLVVEVSGDSSALIPPSESVKKSVISVMTPQILLNLLEDGENTDINMEDISLLIFDECHRTIKNSVYNQIMWRYLDAKLSQTTPVPKLPQVVGLTATPGAGRAKSMESVKDHIINLMANMDVVIPPVEVTENSKSLQQFRNEAIEDVIEVSRHTDDEFANQIKLAMMEIQELIKTKQDDYINALEGVPLPEITGSLGSQTYEQCVVKLKRESEKIEDSTASRWFMLCAKYLRKYNNGLIMNDHVRSSDVKEYLLEHLIDDSPPNSVDDFMKDIFNRHEPIPRIDNNPMLEQLRELVILQYDTKPESRSIIFVKTRAIAKALLNYLNEQVSFTRLNLNPQLLTGANAKSEKFGITKKDQSVALELFKDGGCKLLVATSVAEEGLDIKECNLIITYNYSSNEVGKVQRKGRGRACDSRFIILAYEDSGITQQERTNKIRLEVTDSVLKEIRQLDSNVLKSQVLEVQINAKKDRKFRSMAHLISDETPTNKNIFYISCVGCKKVVTTSENFRHINKQHRVVLDPKFKGRAEIAPYSSPEQVGRDEYITGKLYCRTSSCKHSWGHVMCHRQLPVYVLKISNFLITNDSGYKEVKSKWKKVPFDSLKKALDPEEYINVMDDDINDMDFDDD